MMASGKNAKKSRSAPMVIRHRQGLPWLTIGAVVVVLALIGSIFAVVYSKQSAKSTEAASLEQFQPTAENMDPSTQIDGIYVGASVETSGAINYTKYKALLHIADPQRVAYDRYPPVGGPHDQTWAACNGVVYPKPVRDENMVHTLEHGAVWIAYQPDKLSAADVDTLKALVQGKSFMLMSPYPTLDQPISLQAWGHQLKVSSADDPRIKQFITSLVRNQYVYPEIGATCEQPTFDIENPPAFDGSPRGKDATPLSGEGLTPDTAEMSTPSGSVPASSGSVPASSGSVPASSGAPVSGSASVSASASAAPSTGASK